MTSLLFASEKSAARLLDMKTSLFKRLVADGVLPGPRVIGGCERWDVEALQSAIRGDPAGMDDVKWSS